MKKIFLILILTFASLKGQNEINFDFDYAQFAYDSTSNFVEFYYSYKQGDLTLLQQDNKFYVSAYLKIVITDTVNHTNNVNKKWKVNNQVDTSANMMNSSLMGVIGFAIPSGVYKCVIAGYDAIDTTKLREYTENIKIKPIKTLNFTISDIQLATNIKTENASKNSIFYKNTMEVMPNPINLYTETMPVLFYYSEMYNLESDSGSKKLQLRKLLYNSKGKLVYNKNKSIGRAKNSIVEAGAINLSKYPTDAYTFVLTLIDTLTDYGVASSKKLYLYNPSVVDTVEQIAVNSGYMGSEFGLLNDEDCDDIFNKSKYLASGLEVEQYERLDSLVAKRRFLFSFWEKRDPDPTTKENELKIEYFKRMKFVNNRFRSINRSGFRTDRGRIYLLYGQPDQIDRFPNETNKKPYEIWHYNSIEGGVIFIFADLTGFSDYELVNSTKRGEFRDDNWERRVSAN